MSDSELDVPGARGDTEASKKTLFARSSCEQSPPPAKKVQRSLRGDPDEAHRRAEGQRNLRSPDPREPEDDDSSACELTRN